MSYDLSKHPLFDAWADPYSGVVSYVLTAEVAPVQQSFYYTSASVAADERWLWFYAAWPPNPQQTLAAVCLDPAEAEVRHFPAAGFAHRSPMLSPAGEEPGCYLAIGPAVWFQPLDGEMRKVLEMPADYRAGREVRRLATHLTLSADGRRLLLDGEIGNHWFVATGDRHTGEVRVLKEFANNHNHGQFSPIDPELFLLAHDHTYDPTTGRRLHFDSRIWLMDVHDSRYVPLTPHRYCKPYDAIAHEWWSTDGRVCYVDYTRGVFEIDLATGEHQHVWKQPLCHAHCDRRRERFVADESPYKWADKPCEVLLFDRDTEAVTRIATLPQPAVGRTPYHIDPHPQFSPQDTWVVYTTTVRGGRADVALCDVRGTGSREP